MRGSIFRNHKRLSGDVGEAGGRGGGGRMTITRTGYTRQHHTSWLERNNYNQLLMLVSRHRTIFPLNRYNHLICRGHRIQCSCRASNRNQNRNPRFKVSTVKCLLVKKKKKRKKEK